MLRMGLIMFDLAVRHNCDGAWVFNISGLGKVEFSRTYRGVCVHRNRDVTYYTDTSFGSLDYSFIELLYIYMLNHKMWQLHK